MSVVLPQVRAVGGELIVADGHGAGFDPAVGSDVVWLPIAGASRLELHAAALKKSRGDVVAITEDHVRPLPGWCEAILVAHRQRPDAPVIVGPVRNASERTAFERASFNITSAAYLPPLRRLPDRVPPNNNMTFKRHVLPSTLAPGEWEFEVIPSLFRAGLITVDDRFLVEHLQDLTAIETVVMHFHNGRIGGGTFVAQPAALRRSLIGLALRLPDRLTNDVRKAMSEHPSTAYGPLDVAATAVVGCAFALGFLVALAIGPGDSPRRVTGYGTERISARSCSHRPRWRAGGRGRRTRR